MPFNSAIFVFLFLPVVWVGYMGALRLPWARASLAWLTLASLFFHAYWDPTGLWLLFASMLFKFGIGRCSTARFQACRRALEYHCHGGPCRTYRRHAYT
jgi:alginate O-acetyltransferase complex protein AlgI